MSVVHAATQAAASVTPSLSPSPSLAPSVSPLVHAATPVVHAATSSGLLGLLTTFLGGLSQADIVAASAAVAVVLQGFINKHPWLQSDLAWAQNLKRFVVAAALPYLGTLLASFASGQNTLHLYLPIFVAGQFLFYLYQSLKGMVLVSSNAQTAQVEQAIANGQG